MSEQDTFPIGILFLLLFVAGYIAFLYLYKNSWRNLAKCYRSDQPASGRVWWIDNRVIGPGLGGRLKLTTNAEGLHFQRRFLFIIGLPRLFIPWHEFHNATVTDYLGGARYVLVQVGNPVVAKMQLPAALFEETEGRKVIGGL